MVEAVDEIVEVIGLVSATGHPTGHPSLEYNVPRPDGARDKAKPGGSVTLEAMVVSKAHTGHEGRDLPE